MATVSLWSLGPHEYTNGEEEREVNTFQSLERSNLPLLVFGCMIQMLLMDVDAKIPPRKRAKVPTGPTVSGRAALGAFTAFVCFTAAVQI